MKKKRFSSNAYFPDGLPSLGDSEDVDVDKKKNKKKTRAHRALYTIESESGEQDESSAVSTSTGDYAESLESLDTDTIESLSLVSGKVTRSSDNDELHTRSKSSIVSDHVSSEDEDSLVELDDETLTKDDDYVSSVDDDGTNTRSDSLGDYEDDDDTYSTNKEDSETIDSAGTDETDTCMMSIDEHLTRRHAKWFAIRFGRELKLSSTEGTDVKSEEATEDKNSEADTDGHEDNDVGSDVDEEESLAETNRKSQDDFGSDMDTKTFKSETDTRTVSSRSFTTTKSATSTKNETATTSETATKSETTCKSLTTSEGEPDMKSEVSSACYRDFRPELSPSPTPTSQPQLTVKKNESQNLDKVNARETKSKKSIVKKIKKKKVPTLAVASTVDRTEQEPTRKSFKAHPGGARRLHNVSRLSIVDVASTNHDISVVEPLKKRDAREAFKVRDVPQEIPAHEFVRDDISSIAPPVRIPYNGSIVHSGRTKVLARSRSQDVEQGTGASPDLSTVADQSLVKEDVKGFCCLQRRGSDLELFFIGLISFSLLLLVILLIVIVLKN